MTARTVSEQLADLTACLATSVYRVTGDAYDGPERDPYEGWSARDLDALGDRRADGGFR